MQVICIRNVSEISHFLTIIEFNTKFEENVSAEAHKKFWRGQHTEAYLLAFRAQFEGKMELSDDMVSYP
jgi:hypothetical protein